MKVFLSYVKKDEGIAREITTSLEGAGLEIWDPNTEILPGDNWARAIDQALQNCDAVILILSVEALRAEHIRWEINYILGEKRFKDRFIPVFVGNSNSRSHTRIPSVLKHLRLIVINNSADIAQSIQHLLSRLGAIPVA